MPPSPPPLRPAAQPPPADSFVLPLSPTTHIHATGPIFLVADSSGGLPAFAQQLFSCGAPPFAPLQKAVRRSASSVSLAGRGGSPCARPRARSLLLLAAVLLSLAGIFQPRLRRGLELALLRAQGGASPPPRAAALDFPVQACCVGQQCVSRSRGRHAIVTSVRSQREVTQLQLLEASVRRSNPGVDLAAMLVRGELGASATQVRAGAGLRSCGWLALKRRRSVRAGAGRCDAAGLALRPLPRSPLGLAPPPPPAPEHPPARLLPWRSASWTSTSPSFMSSPCAARGAPRSGAR